MFSEGFRPFSVVCFWTVWQILGLGGRLSHSLTYDNKEENLVDSSPVGFFDKDYNNAHVIAKSVAIISHVVLGGVQEVVGSLTDYQII